MRLYIPPASKLHGIWAVKVGPFYGDIEWRDGNINVCLCSASNGYWRVVVAKQCHLPTGF